MDEFEGWKVGDRVELSPTQKSQDRTGGTITGFVEYEFSAVPGVAIQLDRQIRGLDNCTATPRELKRERRGAPNDTGVIHMLAGESGVA